MVGKGATFQMQLPIRAESRKASHMTKRILVVEDQEDLRGVLRPCSSDRATRCWKPQTVRPAWQRPNRIDRISSSWTSSSSSRRLRGHPADQGRPHPKGDASHRHQLIRDEGRRGEGPSSRCDNYVTKPYSPMQLLRIIQGYLGDRSNTRFQIRCVGPLS